MSFRLAQLVEVFAVARVEEHDVLAAHGGSDVVDEDRERPALPLPEGGVLLPVGTPVVHHADVHVAGGAVGRAREGRGRRQGAVVGEVLGAHDGARHPGTGRVAEGERVGAAEVGRTGRAGAEPEPERRRHQRRHDCGPPPPPAHPGGDGSSSSNWPSGSRTITAMPGISVSRTTSPPCSATSAHAAARFSTAKEMWVSPGSVKGRARAGSLPGRSKCSSSSTHPSRSRYTARRPTGGSTWRRVAAGASGTARS